MRGCALRTGLGAGAQASARMCPEGGGHVWRRERRPSGQATRGRRRPPSQPSHGPASRSCGVCECGVVWARVCMRMRARARAQARARVCGQVRPRKRPRRIGSPPPPFFLLRAPGSRVTDRPPSMAAAFLGSRVRIRLKGQDSCTLALEEQDPCTAAPSTSKRTPPPPSPTLPPTPHPCTHAPTQYPPPLPTWTSQRAARESSSCRKPRSLRADELSNMTPCPERARGGEEGGGGEGGGGGKEEREGGGGEEEGGGGKEGEREGESKGG